MKTQDLLPVREVLAASQKDDKDKQDIYCKMGEVTFITRDVKEYETEDDERTKTQLHAQISVPSPKGRVKLDFCLHSFKQFVQRHLGIPASYILKCPADLARDNVRHWQSAFADRDLLVRVRNGKNAYARAVLNASYAKLDNTPMLSMVDRIAKEANMGVFRYDMPDHSMHVKLLLNDHINMGTKGTPDDVHLGFHLATSETAFRATTIDAMTFRLVCTNGAVALVDGERLVRVVHTGSLDAVKIEETLRGKINEVILHQDNIFGKMLATKDQKPLDVFEETRLLWDRYNLKRENRNVVFQLITEKYNDGTRWSIVNAVTEAAQMLADNPDERMKLEEAAGQYMLLEAPLLAGA